MKKLLIPLLFSFLLSGQSYADGIQERYAAYTPGVNSLLIEHCLQPIYSTGTAPIKLYAVVGADFNFTDPFSATLILQSGFEIVTGLPADFSAAATATGVTFSVKKTSDGSVVNWQLFIRKANKATIPYSLNFGSLLPYNTASPDFMGWAYRVFPTFTYPVLSSTSITHYLAFNPSLSTDSLICNYYASNNIAQVALTSIIELSNDGVLWTTIKSFNNNIPFNNATAAAKRLALLLTEGTQYIRFSMTGKGAGDPNISINAFNVKNASELTTGLNALNLESNIHVYSSNGQLKVTGLKTGEIIDVYNAMGKKLISVSANNGENALTLTSKGIYIIRVGGYVKKIVL